MRLAIFGGTFDPPHVGHVLAASDACDQLRLQKLIFVPAATQPLKAGKPMATAEQRLAMVRLTVANDPRFEVSTVEIERGGLSFTVDTLSHFAGRYPSAELYLLVGADVMGSFDQWREPERIMQLSRLVLLERHTGESGTLPVGSGKGFEVTRLPTRRVDISSTEIRERVRQNKPIHGFVTDDVAAYIDRDGLYR